MRKVLLVSPSQPWNVLPSNRETVRPPRLVEESPGDLHPSSANERAKPSRKTFFIVASSSNDPLLACRAMKTAISFCCGKPTTLEHLLDFIFGSRDLCGVAQQVVRPRGMPVLSGIIIKAAEIDRLDGLP